jgi:hypothetical protein
MIFVDDQLQALPADGRAGFFITAGSHAKGDDGVIL